MVDTEQSEATLGQMLSYNGGPNGIGVATVAMRPDNNRVTLETFGLGQQS
jgi:hypothetical protein